jgi:RimJ/RimL family protein N-acetyltransferase
MKVEPVTLTGKIVRLEPMMIGHAAPLARVGLDPELWRLQPRIIATAEDMRDYVLGLIDEQRRGVTVPFTIFDQATSGPIGCTRYMDIAPQHRRLEIGGTWLTPGFQRTKANTEAKLLLLTHAFESFGAIRVFFKTDVLNEQSRKAILRIGAKEEGVARKHLITASGRIRDTVYYSILDDEWPAVRTRLLAMLLGGAPENPPAR